MSQYKLAIMAVLLAAAFWGIAPSATKIALKEIPPFSLIFLRFLIASVLILPFFLKVKKNFKGEFLKLTLYSLLLFLNIMFFVLGIKSTNAIIPPVLYAGTPLLVAFFSWFLFKKKISLVKIIGILIGLLGVFVIVILPVVGGETVRIGSFKGNALIILGVLSFTFYTIFSKFILEKQSPLVITSLNFFVVALLSFPLLGLELINDSSWLSFVSPQAFIGVFYLAVFATVASYFLYQWGVKHSSPLEASLNFYIQPIVGVLAAAFLLQEKVTFLFLVGAVVTLLGVFLTTTLSYLKNKKLC